MNNNFHTDRPDYDINSFEITNTGDTGLFKPANGKLILIYNIEIFGYCEKASTDTPFVFEILIKKNGKWRILCGVKAIEKKDFLLSFKYPNSLRTDRGDGASQVLRARVSGDKDFDINISIISNKF